MKTLKTLSLTLSLTMLFASVTTAPTSANMSAAGGSGGVNTTISQAQSSPSLGVASQSNQAQVVKVQNVEGDVLIQRAGSSEWTKAFLGQTLSINDTIQTGPTGSIQISFDGRATVYLVENTTLRIDEAKRLNQTSRKTLLSLEVGNLKADVDKLNGESTFNITTPTAVAAVRGTTLYLTVLRLAGQAAEALTKLYVDKGSVEFSSLLDEFTKVLVESLEESSIYSDGKIDATKELSDEEREKVVEIFNKAFEKALEKLDEKREGDERGKGDENPDGQGPTTDPDGETPTTPLTPLQRIAAIAANSLVDQAVGENLTEGIDDQISDARLLANGTGNRSDGEFDGELELDGELDFVALNVLDGRKGGRRGDRGDHHDDNPNWDFQTLSDNFDYGIVANIIEEGEDDEDDLTRKGAVRGIREAHKSAKKDLEGRRKKGRGDFKVMVVDDEAEPEPIRIKGLGIVQLNPILRDILVQASESDDPEEIQKLLEQAQAVGGQIDHLLDWIKEERDNAQELYDKLKAARARERDHLRQDLQFILDNQQDLLFQGVQERNEDIKTGKVFTDIHGNRVRTDQYIHLSPNRDGLRVTSLTYRAVGDLQGISSIIWEVLFNTPVPDGTLFRDLPWDTWLNVVTADQLAVDAAGGLEALIEELEELDLPEPPGDIETFEDLRDYLNENFGDLDDADFDFPEGIDHSLQFIVHEGADSAPGLFPTTFRADFRNPGDDRVVFTEYYSDPLLFDVGLDDGGLWIQGMTDAMIDIYLAGSDTPLPLMHEADGPFGPLQFGIPQGEDVDLYEFNPFGEPEGNNPAYFVSQFGLEDGEAYAAKYLVGIAVPFDNNGRIFDAPGFTIFGVRDLISPNSLVNDGNYNLEIILDYGHMGYGGDYGDGEFVSEFSTPIDVIITPELFQPYETVTTSERFPDRLLNEDLLGDICLDCVD